MMLETSYKTLKDIPTEEYMSPGAGLCAGCGGILAVRLFHKVLGENVVWVNAAGCMTMLYSYPLAPLKSSWLYTAFASAPAGAQGIRDALDVLIAKKKIPSKEDLKVVVVSGDGAAYDIGLQSTSGALQRGLDFYYLVYDNEAYGNTGFQESGATPFGSFTSTTIPTPLDPAGSTNRKKELFEIWRAHRPPYIATIAACNTVDLLRKVEKATKIKGPKLFITPAACPTGWGYDPQETIRIEKLGLDTGVWPLKESVDGKVKHTLIPRALKPVEVYLETQQRYKHLFTPSKNTEAIGKIQSAVNEYWQEVSLKEGAQIKLAS